MADYQKMYFTLFNKITDVIRELEEVQQVAEEIYINDGGVQLSLLESKGTVDTIRKL